MRTSLTRTPHRLLLVLACAGLPACTAWDRVMGNYTGPMPQKTDLAAEEVVIRSVRRDPEGSAQGRVGYMHLDRVRYLRSDPRSVNRVVLGQPQALSARVDSLGLEVGDTVLIWTQYASVYRGGAAEGTVPDWPGSGWSDYPVAIHQLTDIRRKRP